MDESWKFPTQNLEKQICRWETIAKSSWRWVLNSPIVFFLGAIQARLSSCSIFSIFFWNYQIKCRGVKSPTQLRRSIKEWEYVDYGKACTKFWKLHFNPALLRYIFCTALHCISGTISAECSFNLCYDVYFCALLNAGLWGLFSRRSGVLCSSPLWLAQAGTSHSLKSSFFLWSLYNCLKHLSRLKLINCYATLQVLHLVRANSEVGSEFVRKHVRARFGFMSTVCKPVYLTGVPLTESDIFFPIQAEFENICEDGQLWAKLTLLEQLCEEQGICESAGQVDKWGNPPKF